MSVLGLLNRVQGQDPDADKAATLLAGTINLYKLAINRDDLNRHDINNIMEILGLFMSTSDMERQFAKPDVEEIEGTI